MTLAVKPWRVDLHLHVIGNYWTSEYFRTKAEAESYMFKKNQDDGSLTFARQPVVDHENSADHEREKIRTVVRRIEEERRGM